MFFVQQFVEETGKDLPERLKQFFNKEEYKQLAGKDVVKIFKNILQDAFIDYHACLMEGDFAKMLMLSDWLNDGYYGDDIHVPIATVKGHTSTCITMKVEEPDGSVYFFEKDEGFIDLGVSLDEFLKNF